MRPFLRRLPEGRSPFEGLATRPTPTGLPVVEEALAWFECRVRSEHAAGDHVLFLGEVVAGELLREGDPHVHLRKNGLAY
jgi:flavin reductase (DIM6/NTAB) family NADH-FMN oxidoreductase RutF